MCFPGSAHGPVPSTRAQPGYTDANGELLAATLLLVHTAACLDTL